MTVIEYFSSGRMIRWIDGFIPERLAGKINNDHGPAELNRETELNADDHMRRFYRRVCNGVGHALQSGNVRLTGRAECDLSYFTIRKQPEFPQQYLPPSIEARSSPDTMDRYSFLLSVTNEEDFHEINKVISDELIKLDFETKSPDSYSDLTRFKGFFEDLSRQVVTAYVTPSTTVDNQLFRLSLQGQSGILL